MGLNGRQIYEHCKDEYKDNICSQKLEDKNMEVYGEKKTSNGDWWLRSGVGKRLIRWIVVRNAWSKRLRRMWAWARRMKPLQENPLATKRALYLLIEPSKFFLTLKTHLQPTSWLLRWGGTKD